jgi:hypothetical protein
MLLRRLAHFRRQETPQQTAEQWFRAIVEYQGQVFSIRVSAATEEEAKEDLQSRLHPLAIVVSWQRI